MNDDTDATAGDGPTDGGQGEGEDQPGGETGGVGVYETGEGTGLNDTENPLAWIQSRLAVDPSEMV